MDLNLEEQLAIAKNLDRMEKNVAVPRHNNYISGNVESLDDMVYGNSMLPTNETRVYNAEDNLKNIQSELPKDLSNCKLPKTILESIKANPLNGLTVDPKMDSFTEKLSKSIPNGFQKSLEVQKQLEQLDKKSSVNESKTYQPSQMDKLSLKEMIKEALVEVLSEGNYLNENRSPQIKAMKTLGDKFLFLDDDNNVYECTMTFKGKNKKKK